MEYTTWLICSNYQQQDIRGILPVFFYLRGTIHVLDRHIKQPPHPASIIHKLPSIHQHRVTTLRHIHGHTVVDYIQVSTLPILRPSLDGPLADRPMVNRNHNKCNHRTLLTILLLQKLAWRHGGAHMRLRKGTTAGAPDPLHMPTIATSSLTKMLHCHPGRRSHFHLSSKATSFLRESNPLRVGNFVLRDVEVCFEHVIQITRGVVQHDYISDDPAKHFIVATFSHCLAIGILSH